MQQLLVVFRNGAKRSEYRTLLRLGADGSFDTLAIMAEMVRGDSADPATQQIASTLTADCKTDVCAITKLFRRAQRIPFVRDPIGVERVADAATTAAAGFGDCVDKSVWLGTMLRALGRAVRFVAVNFFGDVVVHGFDHVFVQVQLPNGSWWSLDPTDEDAPVGWAPDALQQTIYSV